MPSPPAIAIAIAQRVPAFEAPGSEYRSAKRLRKILGLLQPPRSPSPLATVSVSVHDSDLYSLLLFLLSEHGRQSLPHAHASLVHALATIATGKKTSVSIVEQQQQQQQWTCTPGIDSYDLYQTASTTALVMVSFRPNPHFPLDMSCARRAVTFVHGFIALVTANAYISTLGGGHFLCLHLSQAKQMARLQIAISDALHDPVLKSKCRINLAYNAMREGRFRRAQQIIQQEQRIATETLFNEELVSICDAAQVYLVKTIRLHQEFQRKRNALTVNDRTLVDNFYRQRIVRKAK